MASRSWNIPVASQTIRASDLNGMFNWLQENIVPMSAGTLANNQFSLGTSSAKWLDIYADKITISTGTSSFMGNVGIGTATPQGKLEIANTSGELYQYFNNDSNGDNTGFVFQAKNSGGSDFSTYLVYDPDLRALNYNGLVYISDSTGYVGIGTANPSQTLDILGTFSVVHSGSTNLFLGTDGNVGIGTTSPSGLLHLKSPSGTDTPSSSDMSLIFGLNTTGSPLFGFYQRGSADLSFARTTDGGTTWQDMIYYDVDGGKVGIGTTSPSQTLDILGTLSVVHSGSTNLIMNSDGNLGIGIATPSQTLDVSGNIYATGDIVSSSTIQADSQERVKAQALSAQGLTVGGTDIIAFSTEVYDIGNLLDIATSAGTFNIGTTGTYIIANVASVITTQTAEHDVALGYTQTRGGSTTSQRMCEAVGLGNARKVLNFYAVERLQSGDKIRFYAETAASGTISFVRASITRIP